MKTRNKVRFLLIGFLGIVVLFLAVLYFAVPKFMNSEDVKSKANSYFLQKTGGNITFKKSDIHVFPLPHIVFEQVSISIPDKATGLIQSVGVYPDLSSLMKGDIQFSKLSLKSPYFIVALSEDKEETSLEVIEKKIKSFVHDLRSLAPDLIMTVQKGKLDLTKADRVAFSFDRIETRITASGKFLNLSLTCASNLWNNLSFNTSLHAEDLKSSGTVQITGFQPHNLFTQLLPKMAEHFGDAEANLFAKFQTLGLRQIKAEATGSVPALVLIRENHQVTIKDMNLKGAVAVEPRSVSVLLNEFSSAHPGLKMSGKYMLDRTSGVMDLDLEGKSIDVQSTRTSALSLGGDVPAIKNIFNIVQGGTIPVLHFHTGGKSPDDLGRLENMRISGNMHSGDIYIAAKDLRFKNVAGDVVISKGILEGKNIKASLETHRGSDGRITIGLKGKDAPFHLDMWVQADLANLPSLLKQKNLIKNTAVLREMDRLSDTRGSAQGRLLIGERLDSLHVVTDISQMNMATRYKPLPFPLMITKGQFFFDEKIIKTAKMEGTLGNSSFTNLTAKLDLNDNADLEITDGQMSVNTDEIYPWITTFEKIRPILKDVPSMSGLIAISSLNLKGPLKQPRDLLFTVHGETNKFILNAAFLPGRAEQTSGKFRVTRDELNLENVRTRISDSVLNISGTFTKFPADINTVDMSVQGEIGPTLATWISGLIKLPPNFAIRSPFSVSSSTLLWKKDARTSFDGKLVFGKRAEVSLKLTRTPHELSVREMSIKDKDTEAAANVMISKRTIDIEFKGMLTSNTFNTIFAQNMFSASSLQGDFRSHIDLNDPLQSVADGVIAGKNIPVPWGYDFPLVIQNISLNAAKKRVLVNSVQLLIGEELFTGKGTIDTSPGWFSVDIDLSSHGFDWATVEKIVQGTKKTEDIGKAGFLENFPLKGTLRLHSDFFKYLQFKWEPLQADVSFDGKTIHIMAKKAALCGISTTGDIYITDQGAEVNIGLSARKLELQPTILCLSDKRVDMTGTFEMEADIRAKGKIDTIVKSSHGSFDITAKKGKIYKSQPLNRTLDTVNEVENFKGKLPDLDKNVIDYRLFTVRGSIKDNTVDVEEGVLDAFSFGILARGKVDLQSQTLDLNALVAPVNRVQRLVGKIPIAGKILGGSLVSIPVKITGNLSDPEVSFLSPAAVGSAFLGLMERTIKLPITIIEPIFPGKK